MGTHVNEHDGWWWAWMLATGWPWRKVRVWCGRNERERRVWHAGVLLLTAHLEVRVGRT